jgi:hypothetical protein
VLQLAAGCGGGGISTADRSKADHRIALLPGATAGVTKVERVGDWNGSDDVLIAWVKVTRREGMPYVVCLSVDIAGRIDKLDDLSLVVTTPSERACKGAKPPP